ncbi:MAG: methyltransferase type 11 [Lachnospiraceae bacterium]|nr:methyltransferase type 11 [Lachnospiraceae bacterium]
MKNPWEEIKLSDYENHMKRDSVMQLQALNVMMKKQFNQYQIETVAVLGIAGGNGLEHIDTKKIQKVYGVDINKEYLKECTVRYKNLNGILECICTDLTFKNSTIPHADMVIANLLIEYIGYDCFRNVIMQISPIYVSCIIQINTDDSFVSDSSYIHVFDRLNQVHHQMQEDELIFTMRSIDYYLIEKIEQSLPNGKKLIQLDFKR